MDFDYSRAFNRNIGILSELEQALVSKTRISLAGVGGIGGSTLLCLVRMGFQHFKIADLDRFDMDNSNRQVGANTKSYNRPKVEVMKEMAIDINPNCKIELYTEGINESSIDSFLEDCDVVVDCIDFFCLSARVLLHTHARKAAKSIYMSAPMGLSATIIGFSPNSISFHEYFDITDEDDKYTNILKFLIGISPKATHRDYVDFSPERIARMRTGPSIASAVNLGVSLLTTEVLMEITKKRPNLYAPYTIQIDNFHHQLKKVHLRMGNKGPIQRFKIHVAKKLYASTSQVFLDFIK